MRKSARFKAQHLLNCSFAGHLQDTDIKELVAVDSIENGRKDSLYVSDADRFYIEYGKYFDCGIYNSLKQGAVDIYGINYYAPSVTNTVIDGIRIDSPLVTRRFCAGLRLRNNTTVSTF